MVRWLVPGGCEGSRVQQADPRILRRANLRTIAPSNRRTRFTPSRPDSFEYSADAAAEGAQNALDSAMRPLLETAFVQRAQR
jgi:hypothetical protein